VRGYVDSDWGQIHYRAEGQSGPWVLLFHESPRSSLVFSEVLPLLGTRTRAIAFDTPGYGQSDPPPSYSELPAYVAQLRRGLDQLGVDHFVPIGMKTGSSIATELMMQCDPTRYDRAILYGPPEAPVDGVAEHWAQNWAPPIEPKPDGSHLMKLWTKNVGLYDTESPRDLSLAVAEALVNMDNYASIYPSVFRYGPTTWDNLHTLRDRGVRLRFFQPAWAQMTPDDKLEFGEIDGVDVVKFDISGHFSTRDPHRFVREVFDFIGAAERAEA
jgi:pimeloyl-ACP methyl ester carboxylesterase